MEIGRESFDRKPEVDINKLGEDFAFMAQQGNYLGIEILAKQTQASVKDLMDAFTVALTKLRDEYHFNNADDKFKNLRRIQEEMYHIRNGSEEPEIPRGTFSS